MYGSGSYVDFEGMTNRAIPFEDDGGNRFFEETIELGIPSNVNGVGAVVERFTGRVREGSDDDPDNEAGVFFWELLIRRSETGNLVSWRTGTGNSVFSFSFDRTRDQVESAIIAYLDGDQPLTVVTPRVTLLLDEATLPMATVVDVVDGELILEPIPTVSEWGLVVLALELLTVGTVAIGRPRRLVRT